MADFLSFLLLNILGAMSPGPDFAIVTRYGLTGSRKAALLATLGISAALVIHVLYCVFGVTLVTQEYPQAVKGVQMVGALYLLYLGIKILKSREEAGAEVKVEKGAFYTGFFTNLLNPKCTLFMLSLFGLFAEAMDTVGSKVVFGITTPLVCLVWFSLLSLFLTHERFLPFLQKYRKVFMNLMGVALTLLGSVGIWTFFV